MLVTWDISSPVSLLIRDRDLKWIFVLPAEHPSNLCAVELLFCQNSPILEEIGSACICDWPEG